MTNLSTDKYVIYTDGAARGNPGPAAIGVIIKDESGKTVASVSRRLGTTTNNQAEYRAIIAALEKAVSLGARNVVLKSDSELAVKQISGQYKIKNTALRPLYQEVVRLTGALESFSIAYIPREQNAAADALANKALNQVASLPYSKCYEMTIIVKQTADEDKDISRLEEIIKIVKSYPGQDEIKLSITDGVNTIPLKLTTIQADYCPELREKLVRLVGKNKLVIRPQATF